MQRKCLAVSCVLFMLNPLLSPSVNAYSNSPVSAIPSLDVKAILADLTGGSICLDSEPSCESLWSTASKEWKSAPRKNTYIVAAMGSLSNDEHGDDIVIKVGLMVKNGPSWEPLKKAQPFALAETLPMGNRSLSIDTAAYKISSTETAFGIRSGFSYSSSAYSTSIESLTLYRVEGNSLRAILSLPIESAYYGKSDEEGADSGSEGFKRIVVMSSLTTGGYFDIDIREKSQEGVPGKTVKYSWQGDHYSAKK